MSRRALEAYGNGEKPYSKWTKTAIIAAIEEIDAEKAEIFKKMTAADLKKRVLYVSSRHHTSSRYNLTDFYSVDADLINFVKLEDIPTLTEKKERKEDPERFRGDITFLEWSGSWKWPKAEEKTLKNVTIEKRGCFYYVYNDAGRQILKKKINGTGTKVKRY
jgi:hypothetical protein